MLLPLPVIIVDTSLGPWEKVIGFLGPAIVQVSHFLIYQAPACSTDLLTSNRLAAVQGYVGNVLEPSMFGKSLNLTALSVLCALVLWSSIWGVYGAILSVPLLGVTKLLLDAADFPMAKQCLNVIREDNSIEESLAIANNGGFAAGLTLSPPDPVAEKAEKARQKKIDEQSRPDIGNILATAHHPDSDDETPYEQAQVVGFTGQHDQDGKAPMQQEMGLGRAGRGQTADYSNQQPGAGGRGGGGGGGGYPGPTRRGITHMSEQQHRGP